MHAILPWALGIAACTIATVSDLRWRKIPNGLTVGLIVAAPIAIGASYGFGSGIAAVLIALASMGVGFALYAGGLIGAGDAKLLAGMAALCGFPSAVAFFLYTALCGGVLALLFAASRGDFVSMLTRLHVHVGTSLASGRLQKAVAGKTDARLPYALAIASGFALVLLSQTVAPFLRIPI